MTGPKRRSTKGGWIEEEVRTTGPKRRSTKGGWTEEEDTHLIAAVKTFHGKKWKKIAEYVPGRSDVQCLHRWQKVLNPNLVKGDWTKEEDEVISELVMEKGFKKWSDIARSLPGRIGKQCRERWYNHLNPNIKRTAWTKEEELKLMKAHQVYGNRWAEIAKFMDGRSENSIKNHWNCSLKKKIRLNNAEEKMDIAKPSSEEKVNLDLSLGTTMYARENHAQSLDSETDMLIRNDPKPDSIAATLNQTCKESYQIASLTPLKRSQAYDTDGSSSSIETPQNMNKCYKPFQLNDLDNLFATNRFLNASAPNSVDNTPPSYASSSREDMTPEDILRSAARNFKNIPSIMRKGGSKLKKTCGGPRRLDFSQCEKN